MNKKFLLLAIFTFFFSSLLCMQNEETSQRTRLYQEGKKYLKYNEEKEAFKYFLKASKEGHLEAQYRVAAMLYKGIGCEKKLKEALEFCRLAKKRGHKCAKTLFKYILAETITQVLKKQGELEEKLKELEEELKKPIKLDMASLLGGIKGEEEEAEEEETSSPPLGMYS